MGGRGSPSKLSSSASTPAAPRQREQTLEEYLGGRGEPKSLEEAMTLVNPHWAESAQNKDKKYTHNCQRCIWAVELMRRGYDVEALPRTEDDTYGMMDGSAPHSFVNVGHPPLQFGWAIGNIWHKPTASAIKAEILQYPEGARGVLSMHGLGSGHVCNWEIVKGKVVIYDGQVSQKHSLTDLFKRGYVTFKVARMDNVDITDLAKDFVKRRQS